MFKLLETDFSTQIFGIFQSYTMLIAKNKIIATHNTVPSNLSARMKSNLPDTNETQGENAVDIRFVVTILVFFL